MFSFMAMKKGNGKNDKTRGQMAEARRLSASVAERRGAVRTMNTWANPGTGAVRQKEPKVSVSDEVARFGAYPSMGGVSANEYSNKRPGRVKQARKATPKPKPAVGASSGNRKPRPGGAERQKAKRADDSKRAMIETALKQAFVKSSGKAAKKKK
jgi:hypothetical protein